MGPQRGTAFVLRPSALGCGIRRDRTRVCVCVCVCWELVWWVSKALIISFQNQTVIGEAREFLQQLEDSPIKKSPLCSTSVILCCRTELPACWVLEFNKKIYYDSFQTLQKSLGNLKWIMLSSCYKTNSPLFHKPVSAAAPQCGGRKGKTGKETQSEEWTLCPGPFLINQRLLGWRKAEPREAAWGKSLL